MDLPNEIFAEISNYLNFQETRAFLYLNKCTHHLFFRFNFWKKYIIDCGINDEFLQDSIWTMLSPHEIRLIGMNLKKIINLKDIDNQKIKPWCLNLDDLVLLSSNLKLILYYYSRNNRQYDSVMLLKAALLGNFEIVVHLLEKAKLELPLELLEIAAGSGNLELVDYLISKKGLLPTSNCLYNAAASGNWILTSYFLDKKMEFKYFSLYAIAVHCGHLHIVKKLYHDPCVSETDPYCIMEYAINSKNLMLIDYIFARKRKFTGFYSCHASSMYEPVKTGSFLIVKYFENKGLSITRNTLDVAASIGNVDLVKYHIKKGIQPGKRTGKATLTYAAKSGNKALVQYLETFKLKVNKTILDEAASSGNLELISYLIEEKKLFPNEITLYKAAQSGNLKLCVYLIEKNCEVNSITLHHALKSQNITLMEYSIKERGIKPDDTCYKSLENISSYGTWNNRFSLLFKTWLNTHNVLNQPYLDYKS